MLVNRMGVWLILVGFYFYFFLKSKPRYNLFCSTSTHPTSRPCFWVNESILLHQILHCILYMCKMTLLEIHVIFKIQFYQNELIWSTFAWSLCQLPSWLDNIYRKEGYCSIMSAYLCRFTEVVFPLPFCVLSPKMALSIILYKNKLA